METTQLKVTGMMCDACVGHVTRALQGVPGVRQAMVDLASGSATVQYENADTDAMLEAVSEEGYDAQWAEQTAPRQETEVV